MNKKIHILLEDARTRLKASNDPLHNSGHAERVAMYAESIALRMGIDQPHLLEALEISAWWHDVSRTITVNPSFVLMTFVDDTLSAVMLAITMIKRRAITRSSFLAFRLILSKSVATGRIFSRVFLTKKMRTLLDVLQDADTVDTLAPERTQVIHSMVGSSRMYEQGYKVITWWFASTAFLEVKTPAAKEHLLEVLTELVAWLKLEHILDWHVERYGREWFERMIERLRGIMQTLEHQLVFAHTT